MSASDSSTLLVAIDGSEPSKGAVRFACDIGKKMSASILLVYVSPQLEKEYEHVVGIEKASHYFSLSHDKSAKIENPIGIDEYYKTVREAIMSESAAIVRASGVKYEELLEIGNPAMKILEVADARKVGMIIVGLQGLHGIGRLRSLGSVSRRIIENSTRPVIVVP